MEDCLSKVTIVICYKAGTQGILRACLESVRRHTAVPCRVFVVIGHLDSHKDHKEAYRAIQEVNDLLGDDEPFVSTVFVVDIPDGPPSRVHGAMLDCIVPEKVGTDHVLTLDSDAMPVADGWLKELLGMVEAGAGSAGILHPWEPPSADLPVTSIERRVRSQHCNERCHVACQLFPTELLRELGTKFVAGDDTGLAVNAAIAAKGLKFDGFRLTRCPNPANSSFDAEFNRYSCLVFGDKVYHQWGQSRIEGGAGDEQVFPDDFGWARELVEAYEGAEFLLDDANSYRYRFDKEGEVAAEKMQRLFGLKAQRMRS